MIRIKSKRDKFRRCGIPHSAEWTEYPGGAFTPEQLRTLKAEPMLTVEEIPDPAAPDKGAEEKPQGKRKGK